jgi:hypothetical protein
MDAEVLRLLYVEQSLVGLVKRWPALSVTEKSMGPFSSSIDSVRPVMSLKTTLELRSLEVFPGEPVPAD